LPDLDARAAATPARYEPCSSAKIIEVTFSAATDASSTIPNCVFGNSCETVVIGPAYKKPIAMIGLYPAFASRRSLSVRSESVPCVTVISLEAMPHFFFARSRPAAAESLNDLSPRPPMSYAIPTFTFDAAFDGAAIKPTVAIVAAAATATIRVNFFNFPPMG